MFCKVLYGRIFYLFFFFCISHINDYNNKQSYSDLYVFISPKISQVIIQTIIYIYSRTCVIRHTKGPEKCVGLYRMSEYSGFILVNRNTLG